MLPDFERITVPGHRALAELDRLRAEHPTTGLYPVLMGDVEEIETILEGMEEAEPAAVALAKARIIDVPLLLSIWRGNMEDPDVDDPEGDPTTSEAWPASGHEPEAPGIITHLEVGTEEPLDAVVIGLFPVVKPWEVFAYIGYGGWNSCPHANEHVAIHRSWQERYGAEVVSLTPAIVQCVVSRPPLDRAGSLELAREQYVYCEDIVIQGTQTVGNLAASLQGARTWYFWWD